MHLIVVFAVLLGAAYLHPPAPLLTTIVIWLILAASYHAFTYFSKKNSIKR